MWDSGGILSEFYSQFLSCFMMTKERSTKIVNYMTPGAGVLMLGHGHISHIRKIHYFFKKSSSLLLGIEQTN